MLYIFDKGKVLRYTFLHIHSHGRRIDIINKYVMDLPMLSVKPALGFGWQKFSDYYK